MKELEKKLVVEGQHNAIRVPLFQKEKGLRNPHPEAQWFPKAGLGLFLHWGISSVSGKYDLSWGMITGWDVVKRSLTAEEIQQMNQAHRYSASGNEVTPRAYFENAKGFLPAHYDADTWIQKAKQAGFTYAVLTTRHHDGFALWPSAYGDFSTKNYFGGRDLVAEYVAACRKHGLRVGFYYSPPDWYFNRNHMSYLIYTAKRNHPELDDLDLDYNKFIPPTEEEMQKQNERYGAYVAGQLEELLTHYGKIDLLWFDGSMPEGQLYPLEKIRALQPGIVINHRMHGDGDFETCEVTEASERPKGWWEFCTQWAEKGWGWLSGVPYRSLGKISTEYVKTIAWGGNYLLNIGPMADGSFSPEAEDSLREFTAWRNRSAEALTQVHPLSEPESCSAPAVQKENRRYVFGLPDGEDYIQFCGLPAPLHAKRLDTGADVPFTYEKGCCSFPNIAKGATEVLVIVAEY